MKIKKELIKILIFVLILTICIQTKIFASTLTLNVTTDRDNYKVGEEIEVIVGWKEKMQASSFKIKYDSEKLKFVSASINENFYNSKNAGEISINWASFDGTELTQIKFQFEAIKKGETKVGIKEVSAFADSNLISPTSYDISTLGTKAIKIEEVNTSPENSQNPEHSDKNQETKDDNKNSGKQEDNSMAPNPLPQTGTEKAVLIAIISVILLLIITVIKKRELSDI